MTGSPAGSSDSHSAEAIAIAIDELAGSPLVANILGSGLSSECVV
jgi:hypothetical protein